MSTLPGMTYNIHRLHVELLTPKQSTEDLDGELAKFAEKYTSVVDAGCAASVPDNPMGRIGFQVTEILTELNLPVAPDQLLVHINTFHTRKAMDDILNTALDLGVNKLLVVSGDGNERMARLSPESIGAKGNTVTSVELLEHIGREYGDRFTCGVAFNPYEPQDHELEKMKRKLDAGAQFVITQPVIGKNDRVDALHQCGLPVIVDAWMSRNLKLLSECIGYEMPDDASFDPVANVKRIRADYPDFGLCLVLLNFKTQFPILKEILHRAGI